MEEYQEIILFFSDGKYIINIYFFCEKSVSGQLMFIYNRIKKNKLLQGRTEDYL